MTKAKYSIVLSEIIMEPLLNAYELKELKLVTFNEEKQLINVYLESFCTTCYACNLYI